VFLISGCERQGLQSRCMVYDLGSMTLGVYIRVAVVRFENRVRT
jgi:hypothetical protein